MPSVPKYFRAMYVPALLRSLFDFFVPLSLSLA
jgi:hypothetical protein